VRRSDLCVFFNTRNKLGRPIVHGRKPTLS
jgi:hypothetical protein